MSVKKHYMECPGVPGHYKPAQPIQVECMSSLCSLWFSTFSLQFSTFSLQSSTYSLQFSTYSLQLSTYSLQFSTCSLQSSTYSLQFSTKSLQYCKFTVQYIKFQYSAYIKTLPVLYSAHKLVHYPQFQEVLMLNA